MTTLWLIRHAETDWTRQKRYLGWTDRPLSEYGRHQAEQLGQRMREETIHDLYTSDLIRSQETARVALPAMTPHLDADLRELNFGTFEGLSYEEASSQYPQMLSEWLENSDMPPTGGETLTALGERVRRALTRLRTLSGNICVIAHGGSLRALICLTLGVPLRNHWQFRLDPCTVSRLDLYAEGAILSLLNDTCHLGN
jgi:broad specificity phosphatase PhoE